MNSLTYIEMSFIILIVSVIIAAFVFFFGIMPKLNSENRTDNKKIDSSTIGFADAPWAAKFAKPIMFIVFPIGVYVASPYIGQFIWHEFALQFWGMWVLAGIAFALLGQKVKLKNDKGRIWLTRLWALLFIAVIINAVIYFLHGPEDNFLLWGKSYSEIARYGNPSVKNAPASEQLHDLPTSQNVWKKLTGPTGQQFVAKVSEGDSVFVRDADIMWIIGIKIDDGHISTAQHEIGNWIVPIAIDGNLYFEIPQGGKLEYRIS